MTRPQLSRRLSTTDASFLYVERTTQPMHIGSCLVYDGHLSRDLLIKVMSERMHLLPRYRQRAVFPPFGLAHPTWEDDPDFDVANHIEEITLPPPGDDRVLSEVGGAVHAQMLDRNRPLWRIVLIQGRADGRTALICLVHHAMVDGVSGVDLMMVMHDLTADAGPPAPLAGGWEPKPLPDPLTLLQDAIRDRLIEAATIWTDETFNYLRPNELDQRRRQLTSAMSSSLPDVLVPAPRTPFNGPLSARRQFAWLELPFTEVRTIRGALGGTVNDVVLAIIAGGLGRYLRSRAVATDGMVLRAMCPVSMRRTDERGALGNLVSMMIAPLFVGITDPLERLAAERRGMEQLKEQDQAGGLYAMTRMANLIPPAWQALAMRFEVPNTLLNTVSTNVPGPQIPLYLAGIKLRDWYPLGPLATGIGLFNAILSYNQKLTIGATVDPALVPDVWTYIDCLRESFHELRAAAARADEERHTVSMPPGAEATAAAKEPRAKADGGGSRRKQAATM